MQRQQRQQLADQAADPLAKQAADPLAKQAAPPPGPPPARRHTHGLFADENDARGFWVDVNHVTGGEPDWVYVNVDKRGDEQMRTLMKYLGYPDVIEPEKNGGGSQDGDGSNGDTSNASNRGGDEVGGVLLFSNLRLFVDSLTPETSYYFNDILSKIHPGKSINILHIVTAPLHYVYGENPRGANDRRWLLSEGIAEACMSLWQVFSGIHSRLRPERTVTVFNLHLYDILKEGDAPYLQDEFKTSSTKRGFSDSESTLHLLGWNAETKEYTQEPEQQQEQLSKIMKDHDINFVFCAGGETHWLRSRLAATGCLDKGSAFDVGKPNIVWSGFSSGAIVLGSTTELCAAKNFSTVTNPKRTYPHPEHDDVSVLLNNTHQSCTFNTGYIPDRPPPNCQYSALKMFDGVVFPHYTVFDSEPLIDWFHSKEPVLRIADKMCFAFGIGGGENDASYALTNAQLELDEQTAVLRAEQSFPQMLKHIPGIRISTIQDLVQRVQLYHNLLELQELDVHRNALRVNMGKTGVTTDDDDLMKEEIFEGMSLQDLERSNRESLREVYELLGNIRLRNEAFAYEMQHQEYACQAKMEQVTEIKDHIKKGCEGADIQHLLMTPDRLSGVRPWNIVIDLETGISVSGQAFLKWEIVDEVKNDDEGVLKEVLKVLKVTPFYTQEHPELHDAIIEIARLLNVSKVYMVEDGKQVPVVMAKRVLPPQPNPQPNPQSNPEPDDPDDNWGGAAPISNVRERVLAASVAGMAIFAALLS